MRSVLDVNCVSRHIGFHVEASCLTLYAQMPFAGVALIIVTGIVQVKLMLMPQTSQWLISPATLTLTLMPNPNAQTSQ